MGALLLATLLAAEPVDPPIAPEARTIAVFVHPLTTAAAAVFLNAISVSAGAHVLQTERWSITFDAALVQADGRPSRISERAPFTTSVSGSGGPTWQITGKGLRGLFVTPKLYAIVSRNSDFSDRFVPGGGLEGKVSWVTGEIGAAVDLAFQWTFGRFFLGSVLGLGAGWAFGSKPVSRFNVLSSFGGAAWGELESNGGSGPVIALNMQLLRLGMTF